MIDPPRPGQRRQILIVHRPDLESIAEAAARVAKGIKSLFFCQSRAMSEAVAARMRRARLQVFVHHSSVSREERALAEERFHQGSDACIVCTSTLELGIDVGDLDKVLQADAPDSVSSFLQRMGRTGRRPGQVANTTFFCQTGESVLQAIALVELAKSGWVEEVEAQDRCWPVLLHQLLALALAFDGIPFEDAWAQLSRVPDFRGISRPEVERLVGWMLEDESLVLTGGRLVLGPRAEQKFGRRNFAELYAVFSSPKTYTVQTAAGQPLGSLSQAFVDRLVDGVSCFLLGGRAWAVIAVRHEDRRVVVETAPRGREPTWGGFLPQYLSEPICRKILDVLTSSDAYDCLTAEAASLLESERRALAGILQPRLGGLEFDVDEVRWWTFAGGRINNTLRYALESVGEDWAIVPDNFKLRIRGAGVDQHRFRQALERLASTRPVGRRTTLERDWPIATELPAQQVSAADAALGRAGDGGKISAGRRRRLALAGGDRRGRPANTRCGASWFRAPATSRIRRLRISSNSFRARFAVAPQPGVGRVHRWVSIACFAPSTESPLGSFDVASALTRHPLRRPRSRTRCA